MIRMILLCLLLTACSSTQSLKPQVKYYLLDSLPSNESSSAKSIIAIKNISIPAYLDQPNLVMRQADQQIIIANYHSWADSLQDSIQRVLLAQLSINLEDFHFEENCQDCGNLTVAIQHFYPTDTGEVYLAGSYSLKKKSTQAARQYDFSFRNSMQESGYDEAVNQMRGLLLDLSRHITGSLQQDDAM